MDKFSGLTKQRNKHLAVFQSALKGLKSVHDQIEAAINETLAHKQDLIGEIQEADTDIAWLKLEGQRTTATADKIAAVLN